MNNIYPYSLQTFRSEDVELVYTDVGEGEQTLVFLHGLASYMPVWSKQIDDFRQEYRCIAVDLPGHGLSPKLDTHTYTISFFADAIIDLLKHLQLKKVILVGHSMGGQIAVKLVTDNPMLFSHLVLAAPAGFEVFNGTHRLFLSQFASPQMLQQLQALLNLKNYFYDLERKEYLLLEELNERFYQFDTAYSSVLSKCIKGMLNEPTFDLLGKIIQPSLVLFGENDQLIPNRFLNHQTTQAIALKGTKEIRNHRLKMIPQCGHFLQYEQPHVFNEELKEFLLKHAFIKN